MHSNGATATPLESVPDAALQTRETVAASLRELLSAEEEAYAELTRRAEAARQRRDHYRKALEHVLYEPGQSAAKTAKPVAKPKPTADGHNWNVSEASVAKVLDGFTRQSAPITKTQLAQELKMGGETIRLAMEVLRERQQVRITGVTRGGGKLYALMPDVRVIDDEEAARAA